MKSGLDISTNIGCISKCLYCPQDKIINAYKRISDVKEMSLETFKTAVDKLPPYSELYFAGFSEPWLNNDCTEMLMYAFRKSIFISESLRL